LTEVAASGHLACDALFYNIGTKCNSLTQQFIGISTTVDIWATCFDSIESSSGPLFYISLLVPLPVPPPLALGPENCFSSGLEPALGGPTIYVCMVDQVKVSCEPVAWDGMVDETSIRVSPVCAHGSERRWCRLLISCHRIGATTRTAVWETERIAYEA